MKPDVMSQYGLIPADVTQALAEQNIVAPAGSLGENSDHVYQYTMKYKGRLKEVPEFGDILMTRIGDVGTSTVVRTYEPLAYYVSLALIKGVKSGLLFLSTGVGTVTI